MSKGRALALVVICVLCLSTKKFYSFVQYNKIYSLKVSPYIAQETKEKLKHEFTTQLAGLRTTKIPGELGKDLEFVDKVTVEKNNPFRCRINVNCPRPKLLVKGGYIFTEANKLLPEEIFDNYNLEEVEVKNIKDAESQEFKNFVDQAMEQEIFDKYDVVWKSKYNIQLFDKQDVQVQFLAKHDKLPTAEDHKLIERFLEEKGSKRGAKADLRFVGQVVISLL